MARLQPPLDPWLAPSCHPRFFARSLLIIALAGVCRRAGHLRSFPAGLPRCPLVGPLSPVDLFPGVAAVAACAVAVLWRRRGFMPAASAPRGMQFFRLFVPAGSSLAGRCAFLIDLPYAPRLGFGPGPASVPCCMPRIHGFVLLVPGPLPFLGWSVVRYGWVCLRVLVFGFPLGG